MVDERRREPRAARIFRVRLDGPRGTEYLTGRDLSPSGVFVEAVKAYSTGQRVGCRLDLPFSSGAEHIEAVLEVRHQSNAYQTQDGYGPFRGMGLRIVRIASEDLAKLQRFLDTSC